ncbi:hypothetical protein [Micromonospora sp. NPDC049679]
MTTATPDRQQSYGVQPAESEQGLLLTMLVMVLLGVLGMFLVSS